MILFLFKNIISKCFFFLLIRFRWKIKPVFVHKIREEKKQHRINKWTVNWILNVVLYTNSEIKHAILDRTVSLRVAAKCSFVHRYLYETDLVMFNIYRVSLSECVCSMCVCVCVCS